MKFNLLTIFPHIFDSYINESILKRAQAKDLITINPVNLRDFATDKHSIIDDTPYGGGPGMIMKVEPLYKAIKDIRSKAKKKHRVVLLSPQGKSFTQKVASDYAKLDEITFVCGRYEGFDARVSEFVDEEVSIGSYVLSGGELPALVVTEAVARLLPGVLGHEHSADDETYSKDLDYIEYPQYTRPEVFEVNGQELKVPEILLSGDHQKIKEWRKNKSSKK
ncbi:tRNA (guanosine(37)-N1)-methyltransferase TrmD [Patescibacteria group bacterium]|nr:tRNA (guanosine(37)-N1)-methyltransferase TrmD [Patescibacteria group bacterium]